MKTLLPAALLASLACTAGLRPSTPPTLPPPAPTATPRPGPPTPAPTPATFDARGFMEEAEAFRRQLAIPALSIAVAIDDQIVLAEGLGYADVEQKIPATADTLYPIGSITKTFTSTLMLQLVEEGRLDLEKPVAGFVDWEVPQNVLIRQVLSHTSEGTPGTRFVYSNRFNWLDNVVEAATKERFVDLLTNQVLRRAGLARTFPGEETEGYEKTLTGLAKPYTAAGPSKYPPMAIHSSSGLSSTVVDLARYSIALDQGKLLSEPARERAWAVSQFPYGLGWFTKVVGGERVVWHTSLWPDAFSGLLVKVPSKRLTLVLLANTDGLTAPKQGASNILVYPLANAFLKRFLDVPANPELSDDDRLRLDNDTAAGERLLARFPDDDTLRFNLALAYGKVRPSLRINGPEACKAMTLLEEILQSGRPMPRWMEGWSSYLVAEQIAASDPARAKALAERAVTTGIDTDGLQGRAAALLRTLGSE